MTSGSSPFTPDVHHFFCPVSQLFGWEEGGPIAPMGLTGFCLLLFGLLSTALCILSEAFPTGVGAGLALVLSKALETGLCPGPGCPPPGLDRVWERRIRSHVRGPPWRSGLCGLFQEPRDLLTARVLFCPPPRGV